MKTKLTQDEIEEIKEEIIELNYELIGEKDQNRINEIRSEINDLINLIIDQENYLE